MITRQATQYILDSQPTEAISVGEFFRQINWHGKTMPELDGTDVFNAAYETVGQFFGTFPWQGTTPAKFPNDEELVSDNDSVSLENDTLTLEDLSALF